MPVGCDTLVERAKNAVERIGGTLGGLRDYAKGRENRDFVSFKKDAAENAAMIDARSRSNELNREVNRGFGLKKLDVRNDIGRQALTFVVESGKDLAKLDEFKRKIESSPAAKEGYGKAALKAIEYAQRNWDKLDKAADAYKAQMDRQRAAEHAAGVETPSRENYVPHAQDIQSDDFSEPFSRGGGPGSSAFKKARAYDTYADSIANEVKPHSLDAVALAEDRFNRGNQLVNRQAWAEAGRHITDPATGMPLVTDLEYRKIERPGQPTTYERNAPRGYVSLDIGNRAVAVLRGYAGLYKSLTRESAFDHSVLGRALMQTSGAAKHVLLGFDTFHAGRLMLWNIAHRGKATYKQGSWLLDNTIGEIHKDIRALGLDPKLEAETLAEATLQKRRLNAMVASGLNVGAIADNIRSQAIDAIPGLHGYHTWLFDRFQRGAMTEAALIQFDRYHAANPSWSAEKVAREAAKDINTRFGNLRNQSWIKSKTFQDLARLTFLAPQWNEGLLRSELGGYKQLATRPFTGGLARTMGTAMVGLFVANQILNIATRGHPTWQNPEEGIDSKVSAYIPSFIGKNHGLFMDPFSLPAELTGDFIRGLHKTGGDARKVALDIAGNKLSPIARSALTVARGRDTLGVPLPKGWDAASMIGSQFLPIQVPPVAKLVESAATGKLQEPYPGSTQKQLLSTVGIRTTLAPSAEQRIRSLAAQYKRDHGFTEEPEFNPSAYRPFFQALDRNDSKEAAEAIGKILETHTPQQVSRYLRSYVSHPFVRSKSEEAKFIGTLSDEQKATYMKAREERAQTVAKAIKFITTKEL